jgi:hypothetical protein
VLLLSGVRNVAKRSNTSRINAVRLVQKNLTGQPWLAAERQIAWAKGEIAHPPAGAKQMSPTEELFRTIFEIDRDWMPEVRRLAAAAEAGGTRVEHICDVAALDRAAML